MKIDSTQPRIRLDRLKHPLKPRGSEPDAHEDLRLAGKEGTELEKVVRKLYEQKIRK